MTTEGTREHLGEQLNAFPTVGYLSLLIPVHHRDEVVQKRCSTRVWWAREELNLRPLPCQQNTGNRCVKELLQVACDRRPGRETLS